MADITYTPKFQPPTWRDSVDLVLAEGPNGFNTQFQNLRAELDALSSIVKTLSDTINSVSQAPNAQITSVSQTANAANATATAASTAANAVKATADAANATANAAKTTATAASTAANAVKATADAANATANAANTTANTANTAIQAIRWGVINSNGTKISGGGNFTVARVGNGLFDIAFNPAFAAIPTVQANFLFPTNDANAVPTPAGGGGSIAIVIMGITTSKCRLVLSAGVAFLDLPFTFIAYGS